MWTYLAYGIFIVYFIILCIVFYKKKNNKDKKELSDFSTCFQYIYLIVFQLIFNFCVLPITLFFFSLTKMNAHLFYSQPTRLFFATLISVIVPYLIIVYINIFDNDIFDYISRATPFLKPIERAYIFAVFIVLIYSTHNDKLENILSVLVYDKNNNDLKITTFGVIMLISSIIFTIIRMVYIFFEKKDKVEKRGIINNEITVIFNKIDSVSNGLDEIKKDFISLSESINSDKSSKIIKDSNIYNKSNWIKSLFKK